MKRRTVGDVMTGNVVQEGVVMLPGRMELRSPIPVVIRMSAATEGVVDVVHHLACERDDTHPTAYPRA